MTNKTKNKGFIYLVTNLITKQKYVGLTAKGPYEDKVHRRWNEHCKYADKGKGSDASLHEAIREYGKETFKVTVLECYEEVEGVDFWHGLGSREEYHILNEGSLIKKLGGTGYNQTKGGEYSGGGGEKPIVVTGILFQSWAKACVYFNHAENTPRNRIKAGWDIDDAFTEPAQEWDNSIPFEMDGIKYSSLRNACETLSRPNGIIHYKTVHLHMKKNNCTQAESLKFFVVKREKWTHKGIWVKSAEEGISYEPECDLTAAAVLYRVRRGMTLTQALTSPRKQCGPKTGRTTRKQRT